MGHLAAPEWPICANAVTVSFAAAHCQVGLDFLAELPAAVLAAFAEWLAAATLTNGRDRTGRVHGKQGGAMADHGDPEFVMSQVKLAAAYNAAGDLRQAISLLEETLAGSMR